MQQQQIEVLYSLRCETTESMSDLRDVVLYIARRIGMIPGRVWFGGGSAINVSFL